MNQSAPQPRRDPASIAFENEHLARAQQRRQHIEQLEDQITELAAHIHAATFRLLELIREYDACDGWAGPGLCSCAHWLNWKCGISMGAAREKVRVAHALKELPQISAMFRDGRVSYSKVRAMTRVATPKNEEYLLMIARHGTAHHVERLVRNYRKVKRWQALEEENTRHAQRALNWNFDDGGYWILRGRFTPEQGALIQKGLKRVMEELYQEHKDVPAGTSCPCSQPTGKRAFTSPPKPPNRCGWVSAWMIKWRLKGCRRWNEAFSRIVSSVPSSA